ncbi:Serine/threonine-protein kinase env7 [Coemansia erecta]|uniref:non-specific serine/threonine protein kinase n=1 Tax=Coemansia erecta TaxID=147472 RepID=A0A9W8CQS9_9FUNG|nr:Serine/threonine-protein kinase env7 [Coemansia erecta]
MSANTLASMLLSALSSVGSALEACAPGLSSFLQPGLSPLVINSTTYRVAGHLGSGGFSTVLLGQPTNANSSSSEQQQQCAIKKMHCVRGTDMLAHARREVAAYRAFTHRNIVRMLESAEAEEPNGDVTVYMVFPVLAEIGLSNGLEGEQRAPLDEDEVVRIFLGVCRALEYLHAYEGDAMIEDGALNDGETGRRAREGQGAVGGGSSPRGYAPLTLDDASAEPQRPGGSPAHPPSEAATGHTTAHQPGYVHGDVKLGNVMLDGAGTPVLLDFGSVRAASQHAVTRHMALCIQDTAAEHSTMAYRAPELFDVQRGARLDARTDVWALGCLLYALAFGCTPFEDPVQAQGASIALAAINANYKVPANSPYSHRIPRLIAYMLEPDPALRPFVGQVISLAASLYETVD